MNFYQGVNIYNTSLIPRARSSDRWYLEVLLDQSLSKPNINFTHAHLAHTEIKECRKHTNLTVRLSAFQAAEKVLAVPINGPIHQMKEHLGVGGGGRLSKGRLREPGWP